MSGRSTKAAVDHRAKQLNPNNPLYYSNRGTEKDAGQASSGTSNSGSSGHVETHAEHANRSNQLNPNNSAYSKSRGGK